MTEDVLAAIEETYRGPEWKLGTDDRVIGLVGEVRRLRGALWDLAYSHTENVCNQWGWQRGDGPLCDHPACWPYHRHRGLLVAVMDAGFAEGGHSQLPEDA